jgi:hypothetical protein
LADIVINVADGVIRKYQKSGFDLKNKYKEFIINLQTEDPRRLGTFKRGKNLDCYIAKLTDSIRVAYHVIDDKPNNRIIIRILNLGDHKEVYGKD